MSVSVTGPMSGAHKVWGYRITDCGKTDCGWHQYHLTVRRTAYTEGEIRRRASEFSNETSHPVDIVSRIMHLPEWEVEGEDKPKFKMERDEIKEIPL